MEFEAQTGVRKMTGFKKGNLKVTFPDSGQVVEANIFPAFEMHGMMRGTRTFTFIGEYKIVDKENGYFGDFLMNPDKKGWFKRMFSSQKSPFSTVEGIITNVKNFDFKDQRGGDLKKLVKNSGNRLKIYSQVEGDWLGHLKFDKETLWEYDQIKPYTVAYYSNPLPTDCRFRIDLIALLNEDL